MNIKIKNELFLVAVGKAKCYVVWSTGPSDFVEADFVDK